MTDIQISVTEIEQQVLASMSELGVTPASYESLQLDGELHRYDIDGDKRGSKNGVYSIHTDNIPAGFIQDWKRGVKEKWRYKGANLTAEQEAYYDSDEYRKKYEAEQKQREEERKKKQAEAADRSRIFIETLPEAPENHPYLKKKQVYPYGVKISGSTLAIPLRDIDGAVKSVQWIDTDGFKKFQPDTSITGLFWNVGLDTVKEKEADFDGVILLGEGFATMAKVYELTNKPCISALNCYGLKPVAERLKKKYPKSRIIITADNDKGTEIKRDFNPGISHACETVKAGYAEGVIYPEFEQPEDGTDWDDYALKYGDDECAKVLTAKLERLPIEWKREKYRAVAEQLGLVSCETFESFCQPLEGETWLIEDWLPAESEIMLFAPSGSGKSFLACDFAYAVANPNITYWHNRRILKHGPVVYIAGEGKRGMRKRFAGLKSYSGVSTDGLQMTIIKEPMLIDDKNPEIGIQRAIANIGNIYPDVVLIIIDTINANMSGDENKTIDATAYTRANTTLIQEFGCTVLNFHHTGLSQDAQGRARGSSALKAAMDMEMRLTRKGRLLTLEMTKSKDTAIPPPLVFDMVGVPVPLFFKATGETDTTCVLELNESLTATLADSANRENTEPKVNKSEQFAIDTYQEAAHKFGILVEDDEYEHDIVAVMLDDWREVFYSMTSADNDNTKRSQFSRARSLLLEKKKLLFKKEIADKEYYCLKPTEDALEQTLILHIRRRDSSNKSQD